MSPPFLTLLRVGFRMLPGPGPTHFSFFCSVSSEFRRIFLCISPRCLSRPRPFHVLFFFVPSFPGPQISEFFLDPLKQQLAQDPMSDDVSYRFPFPSFSFNVFEILASSRPDMCSRFYVPRQPPPFKSLSLLFLALLSPLNSPFVPRFFLLYFLW